MNTEAIKSKTVLTPVRCKYWGQNGPALGAMAMALILAGCTTPSMRQPVYRGPAARAPVIDRSPSAADYALPRRYAAPRRAPDLELDQAPADPLLPREYAAPAAPIYQPEEEGIDYRPSHQGALNRFDERSSQPLETPATRSQVPTAEAYPSEAYPTYPASSTPPPAGSEVYQSSVAPVQNDQREMAGAMPEPQPVMSPPSRTASAAPVVPTPPVASTPSVVTPAVPVAAAAPALVPPTAPVTSSAPVAAVPTAPAAPVAASGAAATPPVALAPAQPSVQPMPQPAPVAPAPPPQPVQLPPAEITREGNQAVTALLDSADKYVKSNQLDKAGAALERALRIEPRNAGIWHDLAQIRLHQRQYQQAESLASKSNSLATDSRALQSRNWKLIGVARRAAGNSLGADEAEARAIQLAQ